MQEILNWLVDSWQFVGNIAISIIGFILLLIFRKKVYLSPNEASLYEDVIFAIKVAEERWPSGNGGTKHQFVRDWMKEKHGSFFYSICRSKIDDIIKSVLSTPQQKGEKNG